MTFIPIAVRKLNDLIGSHGFVRIAGVYDGVVELDFGTRFATVGYMGDVFWSNKE